MAIENVLMMNVVGKITDVDAFAKDMFLYQDIQIVDTMSEIDAGRFTLPVCEENLDELLGFARLKSGEDVADEKPFVDMVKKLSTLYDDKLEFNMEQLKSLDLNLSSVLEQEKQYEAFINTECMALEPNRARIAEIEKSITAYSYLKDLDVPMADLDGLKYFSYVLGSVSKDNAARLKSIYNTVTSIVFHVGNNESEEVFLIISPKDLEVETRRILKALGFKTVEGLDQKYTKVPNDILTDLSLERIKLEKQIELCESKIQDYCHDNRREAENLFNVLTLYANINIMKRHMAFSEDNFYFSGWIPKKDKAKLEGIAKKYPGMIVMFSEANKSNKPPTKMKNNWVFKPFEALVKMYGVPAYNELDPTPFLSVTYLFCFGFMFGDVGQGLVLLLGGIIAGKKGMDLGNVLSRMAISSIIFGFIYGSIFGNETLLPTLWVRPFSSINTILITAVIVGVAMLLCGYIYSIINKLHSGDIKEGWFGPSGVAGLVLYITLLVCVLGTLTIGAGAVMPLYIVAAVLVVLVLFREPIANTIRHRKLYDSTAGDYYVEAGFGLFEMLLGMLSNTLSFIRVGAFALTHVGLFMAFETLAEMVGGGFGGIVVLILGNILIIVLEGLIDFIQCLRLQFYELFSKYYTGDGEEFIPLNTEIQNETI
ncbi:V-type ATP synthase subunit I [Eubacterium barkeri]|uniref:V/A-type H+-transporting ATPase subunit I n=1 Tax=Eubacterium barkeri TaxID=1528 RepID=A0A1H3BYZ3_EUBBA|nr:V-type ATPase 116kDa subunit family protein [Eubacterium barkeri]SDX46918.1 V/A-type H+-transporting ATPase subunit I [Eubacterium barkeri]